MSKSERARIAETILDEHSGKIVSVRFVKKDGTVRVLNGRAGVKKGVTGVGMKYDPNARGLYTLFDMHKEAFRMANLNTADEIHVGGVAFNYDPSKGWVSSDGAVYGVYGVTKDTDAGAGDAGAGDGPSPVYDYDPEVGF